MSRTMLISQCPELCGEMAAWYQIPMDRRGYAVTATQGEHEIGDVLEMVVDEDDAEPYVVSVVVGETDRADMHEQVRVCGVDRSRLTRGIPDDYHFYRVVAE